MDDLTFYRNRFEIEAGLTRSPRLHNSKGSQVDEKRPTRSIGSRIDTRRHKAP